MLQNKRLVKVTPGESTSYLEASNPYLVLSQEDSDVSESEAAQQSSPMSSNNNILLYLPQDLIDKAIKLDQMNCIVRFICACDIVMSCLYFFEGWILGLVCLFISTNGYLATIYYKKSLMICYLGYQYCQVFLRFFNMVMFVKETTYKNITVNSESDNSETEQLLMIGLLFLLFFCQMVIAAAITKYYKLLPSNDTRRRIWASRIQRETL